MLRRAAQPSTSDPRPPRRRVERGRIVRATALAALIAGAIFLIPAATTSAAGPVAGALGVVTTAVSQPLAAVEQEVQPPQPQTAPAPTVAEAASEASAPQSLEQSAGRAVSETVAPAAREVASASEQPRTQPLRTQGQRASEPSRQASTGAPAGASSPSPTSRLLAARPSVPKATSIASHALAQASAVSHEAGAGATGSRRPSGQLPDRKGLLESAVELLPLQNTPLVQAPELLGSGGDGSWLLGTLEEATSPLLAPLQTLTGSLAPLTTPPAPGPLLELPSLPSPLPIGNVASPDPLPVIGHTSAAGPAAPVPPAQTRRFGIPAAGSATSAALPVASRSASEHVKASGTGATAPTPGAPATTAATRALAASREAGSTALPTLSPSPLAPGPGAVSPATGAAGFGGNAPILLGLAALLLAACTSVGRRLRPAHERLLAAPFQLIPQRPG